MGEHESNARPRDHVPLPLRVVPAAVGLFLLGAAVLKLAGSRQGAAAPALSPAVQFLAVQIELAVGAWLLCGRARLTAWSAAVLLFATLSAVSLSSALAGYSDCGCFGPVRVSPWVTAALNATALALLAAARPRGPAGRMVRPAATAAVLAGLAAAGALAASGSLGDRALARLRGDPLVLTPAAVDAGADRVDAVRVLRVRVVNRSDRDVRLVGGSTTCICTATRNLPVRVPANGSAEVELELKFTGTPGRFAHRYLLLTDHPVQHKMGGTITGSVVAVAR